MSDNGKRIRIHRIRKGLNRRALIIAFDHPIFLGPIPGTLEPKEQILRFAAHGVDAVLTNFGILSHCIESFLQPVAPALILRLDWTTAWEAATKKRAISKMLAAPEDALRHGAGAVITYLFVGTGDTEFEAAEIARNAAVARQCEQIGLPHIIETIARGARFKIRSRPSGSSIIPELLLKLAPI